MKLKWILCSMFVILFLGGPVLHSGTYSFSGYLPKIEKNKQSVTIRINPLAAVDPETGEVKKDFYIYYRTEGLKNYQVRKMKTAKDGKVY